MNDQDWLAERFEANRSHLRRGPSGGLATHVDAKRPRAQRLDELDQ